MKFKLLKKGDAAVVSNAAMQISGLGESESLELHAQKNAIVLLKTPMTAMELIRAADSLHQVASTLLSSLSEICGTCDECDDCEEECPYLSADTENIQIPDEYLDAANIPEDHALEVRVDDETKTVVISAAEHRYDLRSIPEYMLGMFGAANVSICDLNEHLKSEDIVCGE